MTTMVMAGCQSSGAPVGEREGYFSWVDEQGRVQYTRIPDSDARPASSQAEQTRPTAEHEASELAQEPAIFGLVSDSLISPGGMPVAMSVSATIRPTPVATLRRA
jgi:hypothetical protein